MNNIIGNNTSYHALSNYNCDEVATRILVEKTDNVVKCHLNDGDLTLPIFRHRVVEKLDRGVSRKITDWVLFKLGYVRIDLDTEKDSYPSHEIVIVKTQDLCDQLLLSKKTLKTSAEKQTVCDLLVKQISRLRDIEHHTIPSGMSKEEWTKQIIKDFKLDRGGNHTDTLIKIHLSPAEVSYYTHLQAEIAKVIPKEYNRPSIELIIRASDETDITHVYCIAGGMGPISDSLIIDRAVSIIEESTQEDKWKGVEIILYSSPSPMRGPKQIFNLFKLFPWWHRAKEFMNRNETRYKGKQVHYVIASNTAHTHLKGKLKPYSDRVQDIPKVIAAGIKEIEGSGIAQPRVLILGTTEAHEKKLYNQALLDAGVNYETVPKNLQIQLQKFIDLTKEGKLKDNPEALHEFGQVINRIVDPLTPTHILLACTELPLALSYKPEYKRALNNTHPLIDTDEIFAYQIASNVIGKKKLGEEENGYVLWKTASQSNSEGKSTENSFSNRA